ncbi:uncharacterized protein LOC124497337 [Dermatophagoides farinae]|uniref:uncharacterized protein LOC124497337 n=1 Tax=Dermatophagoides farinae TaxID=6954 RepID=UPI003F621C69
MHLDRIASLFASMLLLKSISFHHRLYYANPAITILNNVLFNNNQKYFHPPYRYRLKMASIVVRNMTQKVINSFVSFIIMLNLTILMMDLTTLIFIYNNWNYLPTIDIEIIGNLYRYMTMIIMFLYWKMFELSIIFCAYCNTLMATCVLSYLIIFYINVWQTEQLLIDDYKQMKMMPRKLILFQHFNTENLRLLCSGRVYSEALLEFLILNIPVNCYLILITISGTVEGFSNLFIITMITQQLLGLFVFHLMFAICNSKFQDSSILFIKQLIHSHRFMQKRLPILVKLSNYGQAFHTKNKYGFTYGKLGLITIQEFVMFLLLYLEFFMFIYKHTT